MSFYEMLMLGVALAADAFAVSVCKGLSLNKLNIKDAVAVGLWFGSFQALMPVLGYLLGSAFKNLITSIDHWIAFVLLALIGAGMIKDAFTGENDKVNDKLDVKTMLLLSVATSIDALAVGITFSFLDVKLPVAVSIIGVVTFLLSAAGVTIGNRFGDRFRKQAEILGGIILILIGVKILLEHLGILAKMGLG